jgi:membrane-associated phospholipid phosphatase
MSMVGALTLSQLEPSWWPAFAALAAFYAFSRMYLRVHYVLDVVAGLVLGTVLGVGYILLVHA